MGLSGIEAVGMPVRSLAMGIAEAYRCVLRDENQAGEPRIWVVNNDKSVTVCRHPESAIDRLCAGGVGSVSVLHCLTDGVHILKGYTPEESQDEKLASRVPHVCPYEDGGPIPVLALALIVQMPERTHVWVSGDDYDGASLQWGVVDVNRSIVNLQKSRFGGIDRMWDSVRARMN